MSEKSTPKPEGLDKKLIKSLGYAPTCLISGAIIGVAITICVHINMYIDFFEPGIVNQLDNSFDNLVSHLKVVLSPSLFGGCLAGLVIGLVTVKIKNTWQKILTSSIVGLIVYLLGVAIWKTITGNNITDGIYYLRFFALQLSFVGILIGLLVASLPQPKTQD